jgi:hemolysin III
MPAVQVSREQSPPNDESNTETPLTEVFAVVTPRLRGWLHAAMAPVALAAGIVLVCLAATPAAVVGAAVFLAASVLLFGTSGVYHRGTWSALGWLGAFTALPARLW